MDKQLSFDAVEQEATPLETTPEGLEAQLRIVSLFAAVCADTESRRAKEIRERAERRRAELRAQLERLRD